MENTKRHNIVWIVLILILAIAIGTALFFIKGNGIVKQAEKEQTPEETYDISPQNGYGVRVVKDQNMGEHLVGPNGMSLYVKTEGPDCTGECLNAWLPYIVSAPQENSGDILGTVARGNGFQQTYRGNPLYFYRLDEKPGDIKGHNFDGIWFMARP